MVPCVVSAVKSGAVLPMASVVIGQSFRGLGSLRRRRYRGSDDLFEGRLDILRPFEPFGRRKPFGTQEFRIVETRLIARSGVAQHCDNHLAGPELAGEAD